MSRSDVRYAAEIWAGAFDDAARNELKFPGRPERQPMDNELFAQLVLNAARNLVEATPLDGVRPETAARLRTVAEQAEPRIELDWRGGPIVRDAPTIA